MYDRHHAKSRDFVHRTRDDHQLLDNVANAMTTVLVFIVVLLPNGLPCKGAWVEVEGMIKGEAYAEQTTDSAGHFIVEVESGTHAWSVAPKDHVGASGTAIIDKTHAVIEVQL